MPYFEKLRMICSSNFYGMCARFQWLVPALLLCCVCPAQTQHTGLPEHFTWTQLAKIPDPQGFAGSFAGISNGALIVAGGAQFREGIRPWNGGVKQWDDRIWILSQPQGTWSSAGRLPRPLGYGVSLTTPEGLICIGGSDSLNHYADVFLLKHSQKVITTTSLPSLPIPLANACGTLVGRTIFVLGGIQSPPDTCLSQCWSLNLDDTASGWKPQPPIPGGGRMLAMAGGLDGKCYVFGGVRLIRKKGASALSRVYLNDAWVLEDAKGWRRIADLPWPLAAAPSPAYRAGQSHLIIFGGDDGRRADSTSILKDAHPGFRNEILAYASITDRWSVMGRMPVDHLPDAATQPALSTYAPVTTPLVEWNGQVLFPGGEARPAVRTHRVLTAMPKRTAGKFGGLDWSVIIIYFIIIAGISVVVSRRMKQTTGDYFLGGRRIPWWAAGLSIFGSKLSALTFIAIPAKAYASNWVFIFNNVMILVVAPIVAHFYLPYFRKMGITSVYEYLQTRYDRNVRLAGSLTFTIFQVSRLGVVIYLPALVLSAVTGIDMYLCIGLTTCITTAYSISGGIEAVVWTEVVQVFVLLGGALASLLFMAAKTDGGFWGIVDTARTHHKLDFIHPGWSMAEPALWVVLLGAFLTNLVTYTSDQVVVQRYLTTPTEAEARKSIYTNALMAIPATLIFFGVGTALWVFFRQEPAAMDPHGRNDDVFPWYIAQQLPAGLSGLVIAGLFAATMATISSSMHSISTVATTDFYRIWKPASTDRQRLKFARSMTLLLGLTGSLIAVYLVRVNNASIFDQYLKIIGLFGGALAGIFAAGIFLPGTHARGVLLGFLLTCVSLFFVQRSPHIHFFLYPVFGVGGTVLIGWIASYLIPPSVVQSPDQSDDRTDGIFHS